MAKVRQRSWRVPGQRTKRKAWGYVTVDDAGKQVRIFKTEWSKQDAENELAKYQLKVEEKKPTTVVGITLAAAVERYLAAKARKRSLFADRHITAHLKAAFGENTPLAEITANRISEYKATRIATISTRRKDETGSDVTLSAAAVNRPLTILRHLLRLAHEEWGILGEVPRVRLEKEPQGRLRWLTQDEATKLLAACKRSRNAALADLVEFALFTGVRKSEAVGLTWDRVDRARGVIRLELTKSGRRREVPLSSNADAVLARRWADGAQGYVFGSHNWNSFRTAWETAVAASGIEDIRFHDLRHTFASWLVQRGRTLREVQEALGHQTITMTMRCSHLAPDHLRAAVAVLDGVLPASQPASEITQEPSLSRK